MNEKNTESESGFTNASFVVWLISISAIWAHTSQPNEVMRYWLHFDPVQTPAIAIAILSAIISALNPTRSRVFVVFCVVQLVTIYLRIPNVPTHIVMEFLLAGSVLCAYLMLATRQQNWSVDHQQLFNAYAPVARWLLIIMYFFGTFHKLNPGFMSLESSCAIPFIEGFFLPDSFIQMEVAGYTAIYATLILEFAAMLLLLNQKTKYYGMLLGMPFHILIGISSFGVLAHFSVFAITMHATFLPSNFGKRVLQGSLVPDFFRSADRIRLLTIVLVVMQIVLARLALWSLMNVVFLVFAVVMFTLIFKYGKFTETDPDYRMLSKLKPVNLFPALFLIQSIGPYIGLSTTGAVQMFSGLRTEGGVSNHYVIRQPLYLFDYQKHVVTFGETRDEFLDALASHGLGMNMYNFQEYLHRPGVRVHLPLNIKINEQPLTLATAQEFHAFTDQYFRDYSYLERNFLHFKLVDELQPRQCRH